MNREDIKIVLVQVRQDQTMRENEIKCVLRSGKLLPEQLVVVDALTEPIGPELLDRGQGLIVGATGDFSVLKGFPNSEALAALLREAKQRRFPTLGICLGAQFMAKVFGGEVITDIANQELGTYEMELTGEAKDDPIFSDTPQRFLAQQGHNQRISQLPPGAVLLVRSERCPIQAFTWPGSNIYAMQLHPDLDKTMLIERVNHYRDDYLHDADSQAQLERLKASIRETPESEELVAKFIDRIVAPHWATTEAYA